MFVENGYPFGASFHVHDDFREWKILSNPEQCVKLAEHLEEASGLYWVCLHSCRPVDGPRLASDETPAK